MLSNFLVYVKPEAWSLENKTTINKHSQYLSLECLITECTKGEITISQASRNTFQGGYPNIAKLQISCNHS